MKTLFDNIDMFCSNPEIITGIIIVTIIIVAIYGAILHRKEKENFGYYLCAIKNVVFKIIVLLFIAVIIIVFVDGAFQINLWNFFASIDYSHILIFIPFIYIINSGREFYSFMRLSGGLKNTTDIIALNTCKRHYQEISTITQENLKTLRSLAPSSLIVLLATWVLQDNENSLLDGGWITLFFCFVIIYFFFIWKNITDLKNYKYWEVEVEKRIAEEERKEKG